VIPRLSFENLTNYTFCDGKGSKGKREKHVLIKIVKPAHSKRDDQLAKTRIDSLLPERVYKIH